VFLDKQGQIPAALAETKRQIIELGNTNPGTDAIFANTAVQLKKQGMALEDINSGALKAAASLAITLDKPAAEMAEMVGKLREGFGLAGSELPKMADIIQRTSLGFGVDPESMRYALQYAGSTMRALRLEGSENAKQFLAIQGLLQQRGVEGSVFGTNFAQMINQAGMMETKLMRHSAIMKEVNKDLKEHNIQMQFFDGQGKFAGIENFIGQLEKLKTLSDKERMNVLNRVFGMEGARTAIQLMEIGNEGLRKAYATLDAQADITARNNKMLGTTTNLWIAFTGTMRNLWAALGGPAVTALKPLLDSINLFVGAEGPLVKWVHQHQTLVKWLGLTVLGGGVLLVTLGGLGIALSFLLRGALMAVGGLKLLVTGAGWLASGIGMLGRVLFWVAGPVSRAVIMALALASRAVISFGVALMTTPLGWIIAGIAAVAGGAYLIYRNWTPIKAFFVNLWQGVKTAFSQAYDWLSNVAAKFAEAGSKIVMSIWEGIQSKAAKLYEGVKELASKIRAYFPFSPAKEGPLRDIGRIRLVETIAASIKPDALVKALTGVTAAGLVALAPLNVPALAMPMAAARLAAPRPMSAPGQGQVTINFSPTITIQAPAEGQGADVKGQVLSALHAHERDLVKIVEDVQRRYARRNY
jgi:TP901 family phage tail tape measure protein